MELNLSDRPHFPWYIPLLVSEVFKQGDDQIGRRRRVRQLLPELKAQAQAYWDNHAPYLKNPVLSTFGVHLHAGLDLFARHGVCQGISCRIAASNRLVRSVGVFADEIWLSDTLTLDILDFGRATNEKIESLIKDVAVLLNIFPLIVAGVIKFRPPALLACKHCKEHLEAEVDKALNLIWPKFSEKVELSVDGIGRRYFDIPEAFDPPLHIIFKASTDKVSSEELLRNVLYHEVYSAVMVAQEVALLGGSVFSNSKVGISGLFALKSSGSPSLEVVRSAMKPRLDISLPWIDGLNAEQVVELRNEAVLALPAFREVMATVLSAGSLVQDSSAALARIDDLRERSASVNAELLRISKSSERLWRTAFDVLGLSVCAYGLFGGNGAAAVAGLLPVINNILAHKAGSLKDREALLSEPAYVLVKARELLAHA